MLENRSVICAEAGFHLKLCGSSPAVPLTASTLLSVITLILKWPSCRAEQAYVAEFAESALTR